MTLKDDQTSDPILVAGGWTLRVTKEAAFSSASDPGGAEHRSGTVRSYMATSDDANRLAIAEYRSTNRTVWVQGTDSFTTPKPVQRLARAHRLSTTFSDEIRTADLAQAVVKLNPDDTLWSTSRKASPVELNSGAGIDVAKTLMAFGALEIGPRSEVLGDTSTRRNYQCFTMPVTDVPHLVTVAFCLTRLLPLSSRYVPGSSSSLSA